MNAKSLLQLKKYPFGRKSVVGFHGRRLLARASANENIDAATYLEVVRPWIRAQETRQLDQCVFEIDDFETFRRYMTPRTSERASSDVGLSSQLMMALLVACGADPRKSIIVRQSNIPMLFEISWMLNCVISLSLTNEDTVFPKLNQNSTLASDFLGPVIEAASTLIFQPTHVLVKSTQERNYELAELISKNLEKLFPSEGQVHFERLPTECSPINSLHNDYPMEGGDPVSKNWFGLLDSPESIRVKLLRAKTDSIGQITDDKDRQELQSLLRLYSGFSNIPQDELTKRYSGVSLASFKKDLAEFISYEIAKIQESYFEIAKNQQLLGEFLELGKWKAIEASMPFAKSLNTHFGYLQSP